MCTNAHTPTAYQEDQGVEAYPESQGVGEVGDSDNEGHVSVPHPAGVVVFPAATEHLGEVGTAAEPRVGKREEGRVGGVSAAGPVVQVSGEFPLSPDPDGVSEVGQDPEVLRPCTGARMEAWVNGKMRKRENRGMGVEKRGNRGMREWRNGRMEEWENGGMGEWRNGRGELTLAKEELDQHLLLLWVASDLELEGESNVVTGDGQVEALLLPRIRHIKRVHKPHGHLICRECSTPVSQS